MSTNHTRSRQVVVLEVPIEAGESNASQWNWGELLDTAEPVRVIAAGPVFEEEVDDGEAAVVED